MNRFSGRYLCRGERAGGDQWVWVHWNLEVVARISELVCEWGQLHNRRGQVWWRLRLESLHDALGDVLRELIARGAIPRPINFAIEDIIPTLQSTLNIMSGDA